MKTSDGLEINLSTIQDAQTFVTNSGVLCWNWGTGDDMAVLDQLSQYIYANSSRFESFGEALDQFIEQVLKQKRSGYNDLAK